MERNLTILYASQTGTAQEVSENIWRESKRFHFHGSVSSMDEYDVKNLIEEKLVIFVCATTGQGDEPDNMKTFWKFLLRKNLPTDSLSNLIFGVIGLGDSSYQKFNFVAKRLHKRLLSLGAKAILNVALCDDQHDLGIGAVLSPWLEEFWKKNPLPLNLSPLPVRTTRWMVNQVDPIDDKNLDIYDNFEENVSDAFEQVLENTRTTSKDHFQDVRLISFSCNNLRWNVGDVAYIRPRNSTEAVNQLFAVLKEHGHDFEDVFVVLKGDDEMPAPAVLDRPLSIRTIATQYWDLNAIPKTRAFEVLSYNCENELERDKLKEFCSYEGQEELLSYANRPRRTILETLQDFPHATSKLTLELLFELFQPIKPRPFSIASSYQSNRLDLLVAVVKYYSRLKAPRLGLCSNWLKNLNVGDRVRISVKKGTMKFPKTIDTPLVMVGPGTGLAIFRGVLQDYSMLNSGELILFFGCRYKEKDFHCQDELKKYEEDGLLKLFCAFSRDQEDKIYVQDLIVSQSKLLKSLLIQKGGYFYVSGTSKNMPQAVKEALEKALEDEDFVSNMIKSGRYQEETWA